MKAINAKKTTIGILSYLCDKILPFIFFISVIFGFDKPYVAVLTVISAAMHELAHIFVLYLLSGGRELPNARLNGFKIKQKHSLSYGKEIAVLLSGPLFNLLVFLLLCPFMVYGEYLCAFAYLNLFTALCNLVPIEGYDGYGALYAFLKWKNFDRWRVLLEWLSFTLCALLCFFCLYFIDRFNLLWWIFFTFLFSLIARIEKISKYAIFEH